MGQVRELESALSIGAEDRSNLQSRSFPLAVLLKAKTSGSSGSHLTKLENQVTRSPEGSDQVENQP